MYCRDHGSFSELFQFCINILAIASVACEIAPRSTYYSLIHTPTSQQKAVLHYVLLEN